MSSDVLIASFPSFPHVVQSVNMIIIHSLDLVHLCATVLDRLIMVIYQKCLCCRSDLPPPGEYAICLECFNAAVEVFVRTPDRDSNLDHPVAIIADQPDGESPDDLPSSGSQPEAKPPRRSSRKRTTRPFDSSDDDTTPTKSARYFNLICPLVELLILAWL